MNNDNDLPFWVYLILMPILFLVYQCNGEVSCSQLSKNTERETKWTVWNGCMIKQGNGWIPEDRWRGVDGVDK